MMTFQAFFVLWLMPEDPKYREAAGAFLPKGLSVEEAISLSRADFLDKLSDMFSAQIKPIQ
jgi:hypothetical protein